MVVLLRTTFVLIVLGSLLCNQASATDTIIPSAAQSLAAQEKIQHPKIPGPSPLEHMSGNSSKKNMATFIHTLTNSKDTQIDMDEVKMRLQIAINRVHQLEDELMMDRDIADHAITDTDQQWKDWFERYIGKDTK